MKPCGSLYRLPTNLIRADPGWVKERLALELDDPVEDVRVYQVRCKCCTCIQSKVIEGERLEPPMNAVEIRRYMRRAALDGWTYTEFHRDVVVPETMDWPSSFRWTSVAGNNHWRKHLGADVLRVKGLLIQERPPPPDVEPLIDEIGRSARAFVPPTAKVAIDMAAIVALLEKGERDEILEQALWDARAFAAYVMRKFTARERSRVYAGMSKVFGYLHRDRVLQNVGLLDDALAVTGRDSSGRGRRPNRLRMTLPPGIGGAESQHLETVW